MTFFLLACGNSSLEDRGREIGEKNCECASIEWRYQAEMKETMLGAMKENVNWPEDSAESIGRRWREEHREEENNEGAVCEKELQAMAVQLAIDFPKDEDRETLENLLDAMGEQCRQDRDSKKEEFERAWQELMNERTRSN
ncbi:MAG: hypothetical protein IT228_07950 [Flavobacteriales bacterium]|nr:hypothetical protein [Flavobacteriales bacterium]